MNKLDELFKEKLTEHSITPSNAAWEKVEAGLSKKNNVALWLRWAAVFLLGILMLGAILINRTETVLPIAKEQATSDKSNNESPKKITPIVTEEKLVADNSVPKKKKAKSLPPAPVINHEAEQEKEISQATPQEGNTSTLTETTVAASDEKPKETTKPIVLVYTLDAIEPTPETTTAEVASGEKKDSSLKRVMNFAKGVKNGDTPFGGIREMKDDLFALELKKITNKKQ